MFYSLVYLNPTKAVGRFGSVALDLDGSSYEKLAGIFLGNGDWLGIELHDEQLLFTKSLHASVSFHWV